MDEQPVPPTTVLDDKTAIKLVRERNKLRKEHGLYKDKMWKTSISSPEFLIYQERYKKVDAILEERQEEFRNAFFHFLRIPPKQKVEKKTKKPV